MNFHSVTFGLFLGIVFTLFWLTYRRRNLRTAILLVASYVFYGAFNPLFLGLIGFSTLLDYRCGRIIHDSQHEPTRKCALLVSLIANLGLLGFFKYYDWGVENIAWLCAQIGVAPPLEQIGIIVPVGISFYTFQTLSYTIDLYRRRMEPARHLLDFALFVAFFPQLVAGPIVRAIDFLPQLEVPPRLTRARLHDGVYRITLGLGKKILIADVIGKELVNAVYDAPDQYSAALHLLMLYGFLVQIYYDFSGYSDIAIGTARLFGFDLPENFILPYRSLGIRDFWRRWHITLGAWLRDYVYFPLGGSRGTELRVAFNLIFSMLLIGVWHGASWLWVAFGLLQGIASVFERGCELRRGGRPFTTNWAKKLLAWTLVWNFQAFTYICVRARDLDHAGEILGAFSDERGLDTFAWYLWPALFGGFALHFMPKAFYRGVHGAFLAVPSAVAGIAAGIVIALAAYLLLGETPFIYFQF